jgi:hypothetical protein
MAVEFFDRRGNETDANGNAITRALSSSPGNRSNFYTVEEKPKTQAQAAPPRSPGDGRNWRTDEEDLKKKFRKERENRNKKK